MTVTRLLRSSINNVISMQYQPTYNYALVTVSIAVAILASYVAIELANIAWKIQKHRHLNRWLGLSSLALGLGIWTMHFIGMFAFKLPTPIYYDGTITLFSLIIAVTASFLGFVTTHFHHSLRYVILGGIIMGGGIVGMHYVGMQAMQFSAKMSYDPLIVLVSVIIAMSASGMALWLLIVMEVGKTLETSAKKSLIACVMGLAISGMHYTGMTALSFTSMDSAVLDLTGFIIEGESMVLLLSSAAILLILFPMYLVSSERRISARLASELTLLRLNETRLRTLIENAPDAFFVHDERGRFKDVNKIACDQLGYTRDELLAKTVFDIEANFNRQELIDIEWPSLVNGVGKTLGGVHIRKDGSTFPVEVNMTGIIENGKKHVFALARDVTKTEQLKKHLSELAMTDELTNIFNRRALMQSLDKELSRAKRNKEDLSLLMIDIDFFKKINDQYGHQMGDTILQDFVNKTKELIRTEDIIGRCGGEEFAVLLPNTELNVASGLAERLRKTIEDSLFVHDGFKIQITISIGVATVDSKDMDSQLLLKNADQALYRAKENGRNCIM